VNIDNSNVFNLELDPFQYFGKELTSICIPGVNWEKINIQKGSGNGRLNLADIGLSISYAPRDLRISRIEVCTEGYHDFYPSKAYTGKLPKGVLLYMPRGEVLHKLGKPTHSSIIACLLLEQPLRDYYIDAYCFGDGVIEMYYAHDTLKELWAMSIWVNNLKFMKKEKYDICYPNQLKSDRGLKSLFGDILNIFKSAQ
jgi:hypothetical protein